MNFKVPSAVIWSTLLAIILGGLAGYYLPETTTTVGFSFLGETFLFALRILVLPLIVASIVTGISALSNSNRAGKAIRFAATYFAGISFVATVIGLILAIVLSPGGGIDIAEATLARELAGLQQATIWDTLRFGFASIIPTDLATAAKGRYLGFIIVAMLLGLVLSTMGSRQRAVLDLVRGFNEAILRLLRLVIWAAPVGLFFVTATVFGESYGDGSALIEMGAMLAYVFGGFLLLIVGVLPAALFLFAGKNALSYYQNLVPAISAAFGTSSSAVSLPVTYSCVVDRNSVSHRAASMTLPLGSSLSFSALALFMPLAAVFTANAIGFELGLVDYLVIGLGAFLLSFLSAGYGVIAIMSVGLLCLAMGMGSDDLAPGADSKIMLALSLLIPIEWLISRGAAIVHILSDSVAAAVISNQLGESKRTRDTRTGRGRDRQTVGRDRDRDDRDRRPRGRDRGDSRHDRGQRQDRRPDQRRDGRPDQRRDGRPDQRRDGRPDQRRDGRSDQRREERSDQRHDGRPDRNRDRNGRRSDSRDDRRQQPRRGKSPFEIREDSRRDVPQLDSPAAPHHSEPEVAKTPEKKEPEKKEPKFGRVSSKKRGGARPERTPKAEKSEKKPQHSEPKSVDKPKAEPKPEKAPKTDKPPRADKQPKTESSEPAAQPARPDIPNHTLERERARVAAQLAAMRQAEELSKAASDAARRRTEESAASQESEVKSTPEDKPAPSDEAEKSLPKFDYVSSDEESTDKEVAAPEEATTEEATTEESKTGFQRRSLTVTVNSNDSEGDEASEEAAEPEPTPIEEEPSAIEDTESTAIPVDSEPEDEMPEPAEMAEAIDESQDESTDTEDETTPQPQFGVRNRARRNISSKGETSDSTPEVPVGNSGSDFSAENQSFGRAKKKRTR